jgi:hypothetical protein
MKKLAIALLMVLVTIAILGLAVLPDTVSVTINGEQLTGVFKGVVATEGFIVAIVALFCIAILLIFLLSGFWLVVLGFLLVIGFILAIVTIPFLFPLLIPLAIVWGFMVVSRRSDV